LEQVTSKIKLFKVIWLKYLRKRLRWRWAEGGGR
jgi:hypothetical protein